MRFAVAAILAATLFSAAHSFAQAPCPARLTFPGEKSVPTEESIHHLLDVTEDRRSFSLGDKAFILKCGAAHDANTLFAAIRDTSFSLKDVTVIEVTSNSIRVELRGNSLADPPVADPPLNDLRFDFSPLTPMPSLGQTVTITGTYTAYTRKPFQIIMTNPSFVIQQ